MPTSTSCASSRGTRAAPRSARPGWTSSARARRGRTRSARSAAQIELARETAKPLVIHSREAEDETIELLSAHADGIDVILHCFSMPDRIDECLERGWWISYAGNVTYPAKRGAGRDGGARARRPPARRDGRSVAQPAARAQERNQPAYVVHTARFVAERRGIAYEELDAAVDATAAALLRW